MTWITENPWPLILIFSGAAILLLLLGEAKLRTLAVVSGLLAPGVYFLEAAILTPSEIVEASLAQMLSNFRNEDLEAIHRQISATAPELRDTADKGLEMVRIEDGFHLENVIISLNADSQSAEVQLRANGPLTLRQNSLPSHAVTRWRTTWILEGDDWKLSKVTRLNPITGESMGVLDRQ